MAPGRESDFAKDCCLEEHLDDCWQFVGLSDALSQLLPSGAFVDGNRANASKRRDKDLSLERVSHLSGLRTRSSSASASA